VSIFRRGKNSEQAETDAEAQVSPVEAPAVAEAEAADNDVANNITGKTNNRSNGAVSDSLHSKFPYLLCLKISHCFTSFR
jgi:hypothetical protein